MKENDSLADKVAELSVKHYERLSKCGKPASETEWTHLSTIVEEDHATGELECVSLGTGSKSIPYTALAKDGSLLHDSHAEVVARRCFLKYLYECISTVKSPNNVQCNSNPIEVDNQGILHLKKNVRFHLFISHTPCGDASILEASDLIKDSLPQPVSVEPQDHDADQEASPPVKKARIDDGMINPDWLRTGAKCVVEKLCAHEAELSHADQESQSRGQLRRKPGRGEPSLSMSCSDKLLRWCVQGIQGSLLMTPGLLVHPVYLQSIVIGKCFRSHTAIQRSLHNRLDSFRQKLPPHNQSLILEQPPNVHFSNVVFSHGKYAKEVLLHLSDCRPAPASVAWCKTFSQNIQSAGRPLKCDVIVEGRRHGIAKKDLARLGSCCISKKSLYALYQQLSPNERETLSYGECKKMSAWYNEVSALFFQCFPEWLRTDADMYYAFRV